MFRTFIRIAAAMPAPACALASTPPAAANWFGESGYAQVCAIDGNITDSKDVGFWKEDPSDDMHALGWVRENLLNPTDLTTHPADSTTSGTDVVMRDRYYDSWCESTWNAQWTSNGVSGIRGGTACYSTTPSERCEQQVVRISNYFFDAHGEGGDRWIICHEVGHAIGLAHRGSSGCTEDGVDVGERVYTSHDIGHINSNWATEPRG